MLDETSKQRLQRHVQRLTNATQLSFAERALLQEHNRFLAETNNEAKVRRWTKSEILGTTRVMSYEDLEKVRAERAAKEAAKEAKKAEKEAKKAAKEAKKVASATTAVEEATAGKGKRVRKRKSPTEADTPEPKAKVARMSDTQAVEAGASEPSQAPVARMRDRQVTVAGAPEPKAPVARMSDRQVAEDRVRQARAGRGLLL